MNEMSSHAAEADLPDGFARVHEAVLNSLEVYSMIREGTRMNWTTSYT